MQNRLPQSAEKRKAPLIRRERGRQRVREREKERERERGQEVEITQKGCGNRKEDGSEEKAMKKVSGKQGK